MELSNLSGAHQGAFDRKELEKKLKYINGRFFDDFVDAFVATEVDDACDKCLAELFAESTSSGGDQSEEVEDDKDMSKPISLNAPGEFAYSDAARGTAVTRWPKYVRDIEIFITASGITDAAQKKAILLHVVGETVRDIYFAGAAPNDTYENVLTKLEAHFKPLKNHDFEQHVFTRMGQEDGESCDDFASRLRLQAQVCGFVDGTLDNELRRQIISGIRSSRIKTKILRTEGMAVDEILKMARIEETATRNARMIGGSGQTSATVNELHRGSKPRQAETLTSHQHGNKRATERKAYAGGQTNPTGKKCFKCNFSWPHDSNCKCPAEGKKCKGCGELGHFESCCKKSKTKSKTVNALAKPCEGDSDSSNSYVLSVMSNTGGRKCGQNRVQVRVGAHGLVDMLIDSGADEDVMDAKTYERLVNRPSLRHTDLKLFAFGKYALEILGCFDARIEANGLHCNVVITVVKDQGEAVLSLDTARKLDLFGTRNFRKMNLVAHVDKYGRYRELIERFDTVFTKKVGLLKDFKAEIHVDETVTPKIVPFRRKPFNLEEVIEKLLANDIIERVEKPRKWCSAVVVMHKPKKPKPKKAKPKKVNRNLIVRVELNKFVRNYRGTPHTSTGISPSMLMFNRDQTTRLPTMQGEEQSESLEKARVTDAASKAKAKVYVDKRKSAKHTVFKVGDKVVVKQKMTNKWMSKFTPRALKVTAVKGTMITAESSSGWSTTRNQSFFKHVTWSMDEEDDEEEENKE